jgi:endonuclease/exonuclease/phosphatase family metal-dependent hydrolase
VSGHDGADLRVMTYNVRSLRDDVDAIVDVVRSWAPDVLLLQEAPRFLRWRSKRAALARRCGLVVATAHGPGGLCVMTTLRVDVLATHFTPLPKTKKRHQRALSSATVSCGGVTWRVISAHFSTDDVERQRHLPAILAELSDRAEAPVVLGGDFNEGPTRPVFAELTNHLQDSFAVAGIGSGASSPAINPTRRIDAIVVDPQITVVSCEAIGGSAVERASDHRPVVAVLRQDG